MTEAYNIRTYTGVIMDPFNIKPGEVRVEDIARALSMMTRANGHLNRFFSIAQHCLNCAAEAGARGLSQRVQLVCLLHDAAECYIADVPRPVKYRLMGYVEIEEYVSKAIFAQLGIGEISEEESRAVCEIDDAMLYCEFKELADFLISDKKPYTVISPDYSDKNIAEVEKAFIAEYNRLRESESDAFNLI